MEQLQMSELMTAEQWIAKLRSKVNEIVVAVNELQEAITQRNLTHTVNMKISAELDSANKEIDRLTKENEELERVKKLQQNEDNIRELILDAVTQRVVDLYKMSQKYTVTNKA